MRFFEWSYIVKSVILFVSFLLALRLSVKKFKIKKKLWWCPLERVDAYEIVVYPKKYFQRNNFKHEILNHLYFGPNFGFLGIALGHFSQCFFVFPIFPCQPVIAADIFTQSPSPLKSFLLPCKDQCKNSLLPTFMKYFLSTFLVILTFLMHNRPWICW